MTVTIGRRFIVIVMLYNVNHRVLPLLVNAATEDFRKTRKGDAVITSVIMWSEGKQP